MNEEKAKAYLRRELPPNCHSFHGHVTLLKIEQDLNGRLNEVLRSGLL